jgi:pimeloyl-ACP methyl ester carboxylesterase
MCEMMFNVKATALDRADEVDCPVFICQASKDIIINQTMKDSMNNAFPDATSYLVEGGGHQCIENRADEICAATLAFLEENL